MRVGVTLAQWALHARSPSFRERWRRLAERFPSIVGAAERHDFSDLVTPLWRGFNESLASAFAPAPAFEFLRDPVIRRTMVFRGGRDCLRAQLAALRASPLAPVMATLLAESPAGAPRIQATVAPLVGVSHNTVHHAHHLGILAQRTGVDPLGVPRVVEWGGGYGNLARIVMSGNPRCAYAIIDTPVLCALQWIYLSCALGESRVRLAASATDLPEAGEVVLIPAGLAGATRAAGDLFISTWALSESSPAAQDLVASRGWYGARRLLLAFQDSSAELPDAGRLGALAQRDGARVERIGFLPADSYAMR